MSFNSYLFVLLFLPITFLCYFTANRFLKGNAGKWMLIVASLLFYAYYDLKCLGILLAVTICNYYTMNNVLGTIQGKQAPAERRGDMLFGNFSKEELLRSYSRPSVSAKALTFADYERNVKANLRKNFIPLIEEHPDTTFTFFLPPFSVLYWDSNLRKGEFDALMDATLYTLQELLQYDNVEVFYFQDCWDIATNFDNYKDYTHYGPWINSYVTESIAKGEGRITSKTCAETIEAMRQYIHSYDFDAIFQKK